jgi:hypothetical protein
MTDALQVAVARDIKIYLKLRCSFSADKDEKFALEGYVDIATDITTHIWHWSHINQNNVSNESG